MYCRSQDQFEDVRLSERKGKLFTFSKDFRAPSHDPPTTLNIINPINYCWKCRPVRMA